MYEVSIENPFLALALKRSVYMNSPASWGSSLPRSTVDGVGMLHAAFARDLAVGCNRKTPCWNNSSRSHLWHGICRSLVNRTLFVLSMRTPAVPTRKVPSETIQRSFVSPVHFDGNAADSPRETLRGLNIGVAWSGIHVSNPAKCKADRSFVLDATRQTAEGRHPD